jgi:Domain of unknown function (DUF4926)
MKLLDVVALLDDVPEKALRRGQVGTLSRCSRPGFSRSNFQISRGAPMPRPHCPQPASWFFTINLLRQ